MRYGAGAVVKAVRLLSLATGAGLIFVAALSYAPATVSAQDTTLQTVVNSGTLQPALSLTGVTSPLTVTTMPLKLEGELSSLTQIQVFIDGEFAVTIPLDEGATVFSASIIVPEGTHEVLLKGVSPFANITPTVPLTVVYEPVTSTPTNPGVDTTKSPNGGSQGGGVVINKDGNSSSTNTTPSDNPKPSLPTWFYNGLVALDIVSLNDPNGQETASMIRRFSLVISGLALIVLAHPVLNLYWYVRYIRLGLKGPAMPGFVHSHPLLYVRLIGVIFTASAFLFV